MKSIRWKVFIPIFALFIIITIILALIVGNVTKKTLLSDFDDFSELSLSYVMHMVEEFHESTLLFRELKISDTQASLKHSVEIAYSVLEYYHQLELSGRMRRSAAQKTAKDIIRKMLYNDNDYFWIDTTDYINVIFPNNLEIEGTSRADLQDINGQYIVKDLVDGAIRNGSFYYKYNFPKLGESEPYSKMSYVEHFEPWDWVIGTGVYIDIDKEIAAYEANQLSFINKALYEECFLGAYPYIKDKNDTFIAFIDQSKVGTQEPLVDKVTGEDLLAQFLEIKNGQVDYMWTKSGEPEDIFFKKIGYVRTFEPREWIVVYSVYEDEILRQAEKVGVMVLIFGGAFALLAGAIALLIISLITKALLKAADRLEEISEGDADLTQRISIRSADETGKLAKGFNTFAETLQGIMKNIDTSTKQGHEVAETLASNVEEISSALDEIQATVILIDNQSNNLAELSESVRDEIREVSAEVQNVNSQASEEASAVEQSSAAVEEMVASIKSISTLAKDRSVMAETLSSMARTGEEQMETTLSDIDGIASSADSIQDFVTVIDGISSQINLLAMNAAIEAAHAGEAGRGFAVVADEIRKLAESTGSNAKQIGDSVRAIVDKIGGTTDRSRQTGESISKIVVDSTSVSEALSEIMNSLVEIGRGTDQITEALSCLVGASAAVRDSSRNIERRSEKSNTSLTQVADLSRQNHDSIAEISSGITDISEALAGITTLGEKNVQSLDVLDIELRRFKY